MVCFMMVLFLLLVSWMFVGKEVGMRYYFRFRSRDVVVLAVAGASLCVSALAGGRVCL